VTQHELKDRRRSGGESSSPSTPLPGACGADGEDVALIDFEVVDASGERCPTDDARVDFTWESIGGPFQPRPRHLARRL